ncbi:AAEL003984-PA [Aedes aegypti]|uniref:AAEL003984-PA n=1 Tax=Aedes aegypti TaxID=7159 RepID=Q17DZ9_AEDAE|nr:AAEL003984-PA [Aedes aegypti]
MFGDYKEEPPLEMSFQDVGDLPSAGPSRYRKRRMSAGKSPGLRLPEVTESSIEDMNRLLQQWGLEALSDRFAEHLIDLNVLDYILDVDIVDLCRDLPIRYRLVLRHNIQNGYHKNIIIGDQSGKRPHTVITFSKDTGAFDSDSPDRRKRKKKKNTADPMMFDTLGSDIEPSSFLAEETPANHNDTSGTESVKEDAPNVKTMPQIQGYQSVTVENYALKCEDYSSDDENVDEFNNKQQNAEVEALRENVAQFENPYVNYNDEWSEEHGRSMMAQYFPQRLVDMPLGFTECPGYIPAFRLKMFSDMANSDYLFVKSIMEDLWPDGFAGRSVTGRASNNASGRSGKATLPTAPPEQSPKVPLEAHKVEYIRDRLLERRILLGDDRIKAIHECKQANKLMARVIINWKHKSR